MAAKMRVLHGDPRGSDVKARAHGDDLLGQAQRAFGLLRDRSAR